MPKPGYYGLPLLKKPVWTWEVALYFAVGGAAGAAAMIGAAARLRGANPRLVRDARRIAALGAIASGPLLIADLGRPERFLNMLRVFKPQSPMSVGAWLLTMFGGTSTAAALFPGKLADVAAIGSAASGLGMATYTGVLIGATAIPVWAKHASILPAHFGASATATAVSLLELLGHSEPALNGIGIAAAAFETSTGARIEITNDIDSNPLRHGPTGKLTRIGGMLSGPVPLLLRLLAGRSKKTHRLAAALTVVGSLLTRAAWLAAGRASARDPRPALRGGDASRRGDAVGKRPATRQRGESESDAAREQ